MTSDLNKLMVGGAQLGMQYGLTNNVGSRDDAYWSEFLNYAFQRGVYKIDTAQAYKDSERRIGQWLKEHTEARRKIEITTKFLPISTRGVSNEREYINTLVRSLQDSSKRLANVKIDTIMFHRADMFQIFPDCLWKLLEIMNSEGLCKNLGISVQNPDELKVALNCDAISTIQMPYNLIDNRWECSIPKIKKQKQIRRLQIVGRSVFLQGLLLSQDKDIWRCANIHTPDFILNWLDKLSQYYRMSPLQIALNFVYQQSWIDRLVIGASKTSEFLEICDAISGSKIPREDLIAIVKQRPLLDEATVDPSRWTNV